MDRAPELDRARPAFLCRPDQDHGPRIMDQDPSLNIMDHGSGFIFVPGDKRVRFLSYPGINKGLNMGSSSQGLKSHLIYLFCCSCKKIHAAAEDCLEPFVLNKSPFQQRFFSGSSSQEINVLPISSQYIANTSIQYNTDHTGYTFHKNVLPYCLK